MTAVNSLMCYNFSTKPLSIPSPSPTTPYSADPLFSSSTFSSFYSADFLALYIINLKFLFPHQLCFSDPLAISSIFSTRTFYLRTYALQVRYALASSCKTVFSGKASTEVKAPMPSLPSPSLASYRSQDIRQRYSYTPPINVCFIIMSLLRFLQSTKGFYFIVAKSKSNAKLLLIIYLFFHCSRFKPING